MLIIHGWFLSKPFLRKQNPWKVIVNLQIINFKNKAKNNHHLKLLNNEL